MKTETQIAEENIDFFKECKEDNSSISSETHKASCQRFLEFLNNLFKGGGITNPSAKKLIDLSDAIKLYSENGI